MRVATGLERLSAGERDLVSLVRGSRIGLLAHPASIDSQLVHAATLLPAMGADLKVLFGPEHGYAGSAQDMIGVSGRADAKVPVHSLYGSRFEELSPRDEWLEGLDAVVVDLQDVGSRYYTFVWSAALMLLACARKGVRTIVLDRPNPLGGEVIEGAPQRPGYRSFVGLYDVPVRHGMTIGEISAMVHALEGLPADALAVVGMEGYRRSMSFRETGLQWVLPSPNMPTPDTALVYPGACLLEGTNLSEGRGTTRPFEIWGAPFVDGEALSRAVAAEGVILRPLTFEPTFHKHAKQLCGGVQVHVTDAKLCRSYALYMRLIAEVARRNRESFAWRTETYEYVSDRLAIDLLTGGPEYRACVDADLLLDELIARDVEDARAFEEVREPWLLYS